MENELRLPPPAAPSAITATGQPAPPSVPPLPAAPRRPGPPSFLSAELISLRVKPLLQPSLQLEAKELAESNASELISMDDKYTKLSGQIQKMEALLSQGKPAKSLIPTNKLAFMQLPLDNDTMQTEYATFRINFALEQTRKTVEFYKQNLAELARQRERAPADLVVDVAKLSRVLNHIKAELPDQYQDSLVTFSATFCSTYTDRLYAHFAAAAAKSVTTLKPKKAVLNSAKSLSKPDALLMSTEITESAAALETPQRKPASKPATVTPQRGRQQQKQPRTPSPTLRTPLKPPVSPNQRQSGHTTPNPALPSPKNVQAARASPSPAPRGREGPGTSSGQRASSRVPTNPSSSTGRSSQPRVTRSTAPDAATRGRGRGRGRLVTN